MDLSDSKDQQSGLKRYQQKIAALFDTPVYTSTGVYRMEDLDRLGIWCVLDEITEEKAERVISHIRPVAAVCPELVICFLRKFRENPNLLNNCFLGGWIEAVLDIYDKNGLVQARHAVLHPKTQDVNCLLNHGIQLKDIIHVLQIYIDGLGGSDIKLAEGDTNYTDAAFIYLPPAVSYFSNQRANFLLYKLMATHKWVQIRLGTFECQDASEHPPKHSVFCSRLSVFLNRFPDIQLARDLFQLLDTVRVEAWIQHQLPGLHRDLMALKRSIAARYDEPLNPTPKNSLIASLKRALFGQTPTHGVGNTWDNETARIWNLFGLASNSEKDTVSIEEILARAYQIALELPGKYSPVPMGFYIGELRIGEIGRNHGEKLGPERENKREAIQGNLKQNSDHKNFDETKGESKNDGPLLPLDGKLATVSGNSETSLEESCSFSPRLTWDLPDSYGELSTSSETRMFYLDEWDFRRGGYRKKWVQLRETEVQEGDLAFSKRILVQNRWLVKRIREQFERIRMNCLMHRRQREGDNIDLDAAVENLCRIKAGSSPSENLYTKLIRYKRDICTVFLIDLSSSTKGTINTMERSALLILAKTLETLNDRFAIYGFSGQTRKHCELFRIKSFHESFGNKVMGRIAGLRPRHCTRIGPPIRRLTDVLKSMEATSKLLVTLTDGKPYDYDGYHGEYALADTRQAILEARRKGVVPFCLTIDQTEHAYLARLYGDGNYVFIDDISKIHHMMPKVYVKLTT